jgi:aldehyde:ferredoxin oxidoreductase
MLATAIFEVFGMDGRAKLAAETGDADTGKMGGITFLQSEGAGATSGDAGCWFCSVICGKGITVPHEEHVLVCGQKDCEYERMKAASHLGQTMVVSVLAVMIAYCPSPFQFGER